jgi:outer membrane immunogenic protein
MTVKLKVLCVLALLLVPCAARAQNTIHDWSGVYLGAHGGAAWDRIHYVEPDDPSFAISPQIRGGVFGPLAGVNRQRNRLVFGLEGDLGVSRLRRGADGVSGGNDYSQIDLDWNAHVRVAAGRAMNRTLLFVAGGLAVGRVTLDDIDPDFGVDRATHAGWTLGGGLARATGGRLGFRIEYLFDRYGKKSFSIEAPPGPYFPAYGSEIDMKVHTFRGAVTLRF